MPLIQWTNLITPFEIIPVAPAPTVEIGPPWTLVVAAIRDFTHLRIQAKGSWTQSVADIGACGPDGIATPPVPINPLAVRDCNVGALIGKLGGSSASLTMPPSNPGAAGAAPGPSLVEGAAFAIGSHCVVTLPKDFVGPLYVGFNGLVRPVKVTSLKITVEAIPSP